MKNAFGFLRLLLFLSLTILIASAIILIAFANGCNYKVVVVPHQSLTIRQGEELLVGGNFTPSTNVEYSLKAKKSKDVVVPESDSVDSSGSFIIPINKPCGKYVLYVSSQERERKSKLDINVSAPPRFYQNDREISPPIVILNEVIDIEIRDQDNDLNLISVKDLNSKDSEERIIFSKYSSLRPSKSAKNTSIVKKLELSRDNNMQGSAQITIDIKDSKQENIILNISLPGQIKIEAKDKYSKPSDKPFELIVDIPDISIF